MYISKKNDKYDTNNQGTGTKQMESLSYEIEKLLGENERTKNKSDLLIKQASYYFANKMIKI